MKSYFPISSGKPIIYHCRHLQVVDPKACNVTKNVLPPVEKIPTLEAFWPYQLINAGPYHSVNVRDYGANHNLTPTIQLNILFAESFSFRCSILAARLRRLLNLQPWSAPLTWVFFCYQRCSFLRLELERASSFGSEFEAGLGRMIIIVISASIQ